jgi:hypothetical protein
LNYPKISKFVLSGESDKQEFKNQKPNGLSLSPHDIGRFYFMEVWKDIEGYEGLYQVSNIGRVKSLKGEIEKMISISIKETGYHRVTLIKDSVCKRKYVHVLVAEAFIGKSDLEVNHINGIKSDNRVENLEWVTKSDNIKHAYKIGLKKKYNGSLNGNSVLTKEQVIEIKYETSHLSQRQISQIYKIAQTTVSAIKRGVIWPHI